MCGDRAWSHFHHQADIGVCGEGVTLEQAFANAAIAMTAVITARVESVPTVLRSPAVADGPLRRSDGNLRRWGGFGPI